MLCRQGELRSLRAGDSAQRTDPALRLTSGRIGGASVGQQALRAELVDELHLHIAPRILGNGVRLFDHLGDHAIQLEPLMTLEGPMATHLRYRVLH